MGYTRNPCEVRCVEGFGDEIPGAPVSTSGGNETSFPSRFRAKREHLERFEELSPGSQDLFCLACAIFARQRIRTTRARSSSNIDFNLRRVLVLLKGAGPSKRK
jgi:hypothetical protein